MDSRMVYHRRVSFKQLTYLLLRLRGIIEGTLSPRKLNKD